MRRVGMCRVRCCRPNLNRADTFGDLEKMDGGGDEEKEQAQVEAQAGS